MTYVYLQIVLDSSASQKNVNKKSDGLFSALPYTHGRIMNVFSLNAAMSKWSPEHGARRGYANKMMNFGSHLILT